MIYEAKLEPYFGTTKIFPLVTNCQSSLRMGILRFFIIAAVISITGMFLVVTDKVSSDVAHAAVDVACLVVSKTRELDTKHNLSKRSKALLVQSRSKVERTVKNPLSNDAKRTISAGVASFVLGFQLGGSKLGILFVVASTLVDFQVGLAGDVMDVVEDVILRMRKQLKELLERHL
jgi:hypothetical protein